MWIMETLMVACIVLIIAAYFTTEETEKSEESSEGIKKSLFTRIKELSILTLFEGIGIGATFAVTGSYLIQLFPKAAWVFVALIVVFIIALCYQWSRKGESINELICFALLTVCVGIVGLKAAAVCRQENVAAFVVMAVMVAAVAFYVISALWYHRRVAIEVKEKPDSAKKYNWLIVGVTVLTILILVGAAAMAFDMNQFGNPFAKTDVATNTDEGVDGDFDERFVQEWTENEENRLDSEFAAKLASKAEADNGTITPEIVQEAVLENCGHDARMLAIWANAFGLRDDPNEYEDLLVEDKSYLSTAGIELYNKVDGYLAATSVTREEAPEDGTNSGYDDGYVVAESAGIDGDRSATKFDSPDASVEPFWLMDRCSNLVYKKPPKNVPRGDTDNPTPTPDNPKKEPSEDPVNKGNANKGGGQSKPNDGAGENQPTDPRTEHPTGSQNNNNKGYSDPATVTPSNPPATKSGPVATDSNPMNYKPDPVTNRGPADSSKKPTSSEGDGEFTPAD